MVYEIILAARIGAVDIVNGVVVDGKWIVAKDHADLGKIVDKLKSIAGDSYVEYGEVGVLKMSCDEFYKIRDSGSVFSTGVWDRSLENYQVKFQHSKDNSSRWVLLIVKNEEEAARTEMRFDVDFVDAED